MKRLIFSLLLVFFSCTSIQLSEQSLFYPIKEYTLNKNFRLDRQFIVTEDSVRIETWCLYHEKPEVNIIFFQGNGYNIRFKIPLLNELGKTVQSNIFTFNYRGFGLSEGNPSIDGIVEDGKAAVKYFTSRIDTIHQLPTYLIGYSIGSFVGLKNMNIKQINGIVLISPFTSAEEMIHYLKHKNLPFYKRPFVKLEISNNIYKLDNLSLIKNVNKPILFIHGTDDNFVPPSMSEELYKISEAKKKKLLLISGANHQTIVTEKKFIEQVTAGIKEFIHQTK